MRAQCKAHEMHVTTYRAFSVCFECRRVACCVVLNVHVLIFPCASFFMLKNGARAMRCAVCTFGTVSRIVVVCRVLLRGLLCVLINFANFLRTLRI